MPITNMDADPCKSDYTSLDLLDGILNGLHKATLWQVDLVRLVCHSRQVVLLMLVVLLHALGPAYRLRQLNVSQGRCLQGFAVL